MIKKVMEIVGSCSANNFVLQLSSIYKYCLLTFHLVWLSLSLLLLRNFTRIIFRMKEVNFLDINTGSNHFKRTDVQKCSQGYSRKIRMGGGGSRYFFGWVVVSWGEFIFMGGGVVGKYISMGGCLLCK